jgi:hypothetical protein
LPQCALPVFAGCRSIAATTAAAIRWRSAVTDDIRLSDIEPRFVCTACGMGGAEVRPDFNWREKPVGMMGYR